MKKERTGGKQKISRGGCVFLGLVIVAYGILYRCAPGKTGQAITASLRLLGQVIPILLLVICFMGLVDFLVPRRAAVRYLGGGSGAKGWLLAIMAGILSQGPVFVWYPMLRDLRERGMRPGLAAVFLYNRAVKIPLLLVMVFYFSFQFTVVLSVYMIIASVIVGYLVEVLASGEPDPIAAGDNEVVNS